MKDRLDQHGMIHRADVVRRLRRSMAWLMKCALPLVLFLVFVAPAAAQQESSSEAQQESSSGAQEETSSKTQQESSSEAQRASSSGLYEDLSAQANGRTSAAAQRESISLAEADALIRDIFATEDTSQYAKGADLYLERLTEPGRSQVARRAFVAYLTSAMQVMPPSERPPALAGDYEYDDLRRTGEAVVRWWRRQDPFPATQRNERLEEHLARVGYATEQFGRSGGGYDVRGEIFVRLGPPGRRQSIRLNEIVRAFDLQSTSMVPSLPDNELWVYRHVHDEAYFFFIRDSRRSEFREARPSELIPRRIREGIDVQTERGRERAEILLLVMEEIYAQLALAHPLFGSTHDRIARFRGLPPTRTERPNQVARSTMAAAVNIETESAGRRNDVVPASYSQLVELFDELPIDSRWARFMDPDGTTRTEVYWSVDPEVLQPSRQLADRLSNAGFTESDDYLLAVSVARYTNEHVFRDVETKHYMVRPDADRRTVQTFTVRGDTGAYSLGMQWADHWALPTEDGKMGEGAVLKLATVRLDTLNALDDGGVRLEMSDLKPVFSGRDIPFPYRRFRRSNPPDLVFEVYHLNFGPDDRTHYSIEYEISRGVGRQTSTTRAKTSATSSSRSVDERITIDLGDWTDEGSVRVTVRVSDDVTQQTMTRSISFDLD